MIALLWRLLTKQVSIDPTHGDPALRALREQARSGDDGPVRQALQQTRGDFDRRDTYVRQLADAMASGARPDATGRIDTDATWADRWAVHQPFDPDAQLLRAESLIARAWEVRGSGWASSVDSTQAAEFFRLLELARQVNDEAIRLAPADPTPWSQRLQLLIGLRGSRADADRVWQELTARDPGHHRGHVRRLSYLCRKWYGSHEDMFGFARSAAAAAPPGSSLLVLPVRAAAEWALWEQERAGTTDVSERWRRDPAMQADLDAALNGWFRASPPRHRAWHDDLNHLAYGLSRCGRHAEAAPVFAAIGPYVETTVWGWWSEDERADTSFFAARKQARRAA